MGTEGEYQFSNGGIINSELDNERNAPVSVHEVQHAILYTTTTFGQLTIMLEKNTLFHEKSKWLYQELFNYMNRMQERIAVNIEHINIYIKEGKKAYDEAVEKLEIKNRTYYNYFKKLCCINGRISTVDDAKKVVKWLQSIGQLALNINIEDIPFEDMNTPKDLQRFFSEGNNAKKYIPNRRFDILINNFYRSNNSTKELELVEEGTISVEESNAENIHKIAEDKAKKILKDSPLYERLVQRISTVGTKRIDLQLDNIEYLLNMPIEIDRKEKSEVIFEKAKDFLERLEKNEYKKSIVSLLHSLGGFEDMHFVSLFDSRLKKFYATVVTNDEEFDNFISLIPQHIVFIQTKLFKKMKCRIRGLSKQLPIFICLENPVYYGMDFIEKNFKNGNYSFLKREKYTALVVWRRHFVFIAYIIELAKNELKNIFTQYNIEYIPYENAEIDKECVEMVVSQCMENMILAKNLKEEELR